MLLQIMVNSFAIGTAYALIAMGYSLIFGASDLINFAQGEFYMLGAFVGLTCYVLRHMPITITLMGVVGIMFVIGYFCERELIRPMILKGAKNHLHFILMTLGLSILLKNIAMFVWGVRPFSFPAIFDARPRLIAGIVIIPQSLWIAAISIFLMISVAVFLRRTKLGAAMRATAFNKEVASLMGINVYFISGLGFAISAALCGIAGTLLAPLFTVEFNMGTMISLKGFAAAILGGLGNLFGAVIGGVIVGLLEGVAAGFISSVWRDGITFALIILILFFRPNGILGKRSIRRV